MINRDIRQYNYYLLDGVNAYGQPQITDEVQGSISIAIYTTSQSVIDNIKYKNASFVGLTNAPITDAYIIQYQEAKLKVLYIQPQGRYKQVFLAEI